MFNYIKETIINDVTNKCVVTDDKGLKAGDAGVGTLSTLVVKRGGNYKFNQICDKKVFKTAGVSGSVATLTIDPSKFTASQDYRQFAIFVSTPSKELSDYGYANWQEFGKPILIESVESTAANLVEVFKLALPNDNPFYTVEVDSSKVKLTFKESWMDVAEAHVYEVKDGVTTENTTAGTTTIVHNVEEFATAKWLVENLRFPSYPNIRYNHLYADESPVAGTLYNQYAFQYIVKHSVPGGLSSVGQAVDSITTHVFYVPQSSASAFEAFFTANGCSIDTTVGNVASMDVNSNALADVAATASAASTSGTATSAPTTTTVGKVGDTLIYDSDVYTCTAIDTSGDTPSYTWVKTYDAT